MAFTQLYQNDLRWQNKIMGNGRTETIGNLGCLVTSLTMMGNYFGGNETVASFNDKMKQNNGFQGPWVRAFRVNSVFPNVSYQKHIECDNQDAPLDELDAALAGGSLATVRVDYSPAAVEEAHLSYILGTAFGRWDIRYATGERQSPELPEPFDPLPVCPPGMLQNAEGLPAEPKDVPADYPLRISWPGILVDDENHPEDIVARAKRDEVSYPVVIMGHSLGGNESSKFANYLGSRGVKVSLVVTFDPVETGRVGANIDRVVNYYLPMQKEDNTIHAAGGFAGTIENIDVTADPSITHTNVEKNARFQAASMNKLNEITKAL